MDYLDQSFDSFIKKRSPDLKERFTGIYRAEVVETNDPLNRQRVRIRISDLHNRDLKPEDLPWASYCNEFGDKGAGNWCNFIIGDRVYVAFEKNHPYAPIIVGGGAPTRRKAYPLQSIHTPTPLAVKEDGTPDDQPKDFDWDYLPKDRRPMSIGWKDRYGSFIRLNSIGFFPDEHKKEPAPAGLDGITQKEFSASDDEPVKNDPDIKHIVINTKYGNTFILNDTGYDWEGEFDGDFDKDEEFEQKRALYLNKLFNEDKPTDTDQRRIEMRTRYGHKFEMRDVGWNKTRIGEYSDEKVEIAKETTDQRWIKVKTKAGHIIQSWDKGAHPEDNINIKKKLIEDIGESDNEDKWGDDARQIRVITASGSKFVIDDRGSDAIDPKNPLIYGNGILLKSKKGFSLDINDKPSLNRMQLYSPGNQGLEINDKFEYVMLCSTSPTISNGPSKGTEDNEFNLKTFKNSEPELKSFHLLMDNKNKYSRFSSPLQQSVEFHDNSECGTWAQLRDAEKRGVWLSKDLSLAAFKNKDDNIYLVFDDKGNNAILRNNKGTIQIIASGNVEIKGTKISLIADEISMKARTIKMHGGKTQAVLDDASFGVNHTFESAIVKFNTGGTSPGRSTNITEFKETIIPQISPTNIGVGCSSNNTEAIAVIDGNILKDKDN